MEACNSMASKAERWLPLLVWMVLISTFSTDHFSNEKTGSVIEPLLRLLFSGASQDFLSRIHFMIRKSAHLTEYALLGSLWYWSIKPGIRGWSRNAAIAALMFSFVYASLDEFHQTFTLNREGNPVDVLIDSTGAAMGILAIWIYNTMMQRYRNE